MGLATRVKNAWNAFLHKDSSIYNTDFGPGYSSRSDRRIVTRGNERSMVNAVLNRMAMDVAAVAIKHVELDEEGRFVREIDSTINERFNLSANIDQTGRAFVQDIAMSMFDEGQCALVPVECDTDPMDTESYKVYSVRVGKVTQWYREKVEVECFNELRSSRDRLIVDKNYVPIVENPMYYIMNSPSSTLQRLMRKIALLDVIDDENGSGKLNMIIQLPYVIKTKAREDQAESRRKSIERQLSENKYGIAYIDGTEKITQLNRPLENNLLAQIEYLYNLFLSQLGLTPEILNQTADEGVMNNYYNRIIEPILSAITDEVKRKWLSPNARSRGQTIKFFRDPFKLIPINSLADLADKLIRNEILAPNEMRQLMGIKPAADPKADQLRNPNISESKEQIAMDQEEFQNGVTDTDYTELLNGSYNN